MNGARLIVFALCLGFISTACATGPSSTSPDTRQRRAGLEAIILSAEPGDERGTLQIELKNGTSRLIGANMCRITLEALQEDGVSWEPVPVEFQRDCVDSDDPIGPDGVRQANYSLVDPRESLPAGELRFSMSVEYPIGVDFNQISSQTFVLIGDEQEVPEEPEESEDFPEELPEEEPAELEEPAESGEGED